MAGKLWIVSALVILGLAWAWAAPGGGHSGYGAIGIEDSHKGHHDYYSHPKYKYGYGVQDIKKGDKKTAAEWRDGKVTKGHYSLQEPDGSWRTVNYVADEKGFRAQVHRSPNLHPGIGGHHH